MSNFNNKELNTLLLKRKGGLTSIKIIDAILKQPYNANQLSKVLHLDYKTVKYHMSLFCEAKYLVKEDEKYGALYYPSEKLKDNLNDYEKIKKILKK